MKILLIDDEKSLIEILNRELVREGHTVETAENDKKGGKSLFEFLNRLI